MTRLLLADDHKIMRDGLRSLLEGRPDVEVVGEADNGLAAVDMARSLCPDIVVMDVAMPQLSGIEATRRIVADAPGTRVIALSMHSDRRYVAEMLKAGAKAYLLKDSAFEELTEAMRTVLAGDVYLSQGVAGVVVQDYVHHLNEEAESASGDAVRKLTRREREVLQLAAEGKSTKQIAAALTLSVKTVETHRRQIMDKLGIYNLAGLIKFAIREGLATLDE